MVLAVPPPPRVGHANHFNNIISGQNVTAIGRTAEKIGYSREVKVRAYDIMGVEKTRLSTLPRGGIGRIKQNSRQYVFRSQSPR